MDYTDRTKLPISIPTLSLGSVKGVIFNNKMLISCIVGLVIQIYELLAWNSIGCMVVYNSCIVEFRIFIIGRSIRTIIVFAYSCVLPILRGEVVVDIYEFRVCL